MTFFPFLFAVIALTTNAALALEAPPTQQIDSEDLLRHEFCDHDYAALKNGMCSPPTTPQLKIFFPQARGAIVAKHVAAMEERHFFRAMDPADFFHGHLIVRGENYKADTALRYESTAAYFADLSGILYHTDEYTDRWDTGEGDSVPGQKTPRSLFGWLDGALVPAITIVKPSLLVSSTYEDFGTLYSSDIVQSNPAMTRLEYSWGDSTAAKLTEKVGEQTETCSPDTMFYLRPQTDGRFQLASGLRYEIFLYCSTD